ncbi:MAG TPA: signal peptide peptidase SppA [Candidatus Hydrogenedentes bacterium]|nr:signal peptide peptidase SppA [Candidatus Hydrogenedentota bacterium]HOS03233.1 signal peptide peptidase SppA [Candidatus Hydrogenedentota bacterium]
MTYETPPSPPRRRRGCASCMGAAIAVFCMASLGALLITAIALGVYPPKEWQNLVYAPGVAVLDIQGEVFDEQPVLDDLTELLDNDNTRALVVRVDSPGGAIAAVEEIYEAINRTRETGLPVVASMGPTAASGGYLLCLPSDKIFANQGSLTGSVGVLLEYSSAKEMFDKIGIRFDTIASGEFKGEGGIASPLTDRQRAQLQEVVQDYHEQFVEILCKNRKVDPEKLRALADGRLFTGRQALAEGLIDEIGTLNDAVNHAAALAGLESDPRVIRVRPRSVSWLAELSRWSGEASARAMQRATVPKFLMR